MNQPRNAREHVVEEPGTQVHAETAEERQRGSDRDDLGQQGQSLLLNLGRGLKDGDDRSDERCQSEDREHEDRGDDQRFPQEDREFGHAAIMAETADQIRAEMLRRGYPRTAFVNSHSSGQPRVLGAAAEAGSFSHAAIALNAAHAPAHNSSRFTGAPSNMPQKRRQLAAVRSPSPAKKRNGTAA